MALVVHKYGGTSMGSIDRIKNVARRVAKWHDAGYQVVVVPSAMAGETNRLIGLAREIMPEPDQRELDMVTSTGEQVSIGLLSMALLQLGKEAVSFTGWQVPVKTDTSHTKARIQSIDEARIRENLDKGKIVIIAGFQGISDAGNITTLGRGGLRKSLLKKCWKWLRWVPRFCRRVRWNWRAITMCQPGYCPLLPIPTYLWKKNPAPAP